jgi:hypothetical protein
VESIVRTTEEIVALAEQARAASERADEDPFERDLAAGIEYALRWVLGDEYLPALVQRREGP